MRKKIDWTLIGAKTQAIRLLALLFDTTFNYANKLGQHERDN
jgi:hypothetical protein